ncbi:protein split ends-like isoform X2 [Microplitis mediator]|uniref:protein split ends-like isoform X2 n=1 Tax=Microplitis mediator TaxID=375433 RepID=UPI002553DF83|nr:protein split ends-like isoform X2 [Microplitis mediator]
MSDSDSHSEDDNFQIIIRITRYGRVQSVKLLPRGEECPVDGGSAGSLGEGSEGGSGTGSGSGSAGGGSTSSGGASATVAFMDIKSAAKAHATEHTLDERALTTQYYEPQLIQHRFPTHGNSEDHGTSVGVSVVGSGVSGNAVNVGVSERGVERVSETFESRVSHGNFYTGERSNRVEHSVDPSTVDPVGGYIPRSRPTPSGGYHVTAPRARERLYPRPSSYVTGPPPSSHLERHRGAISMSSWLGYESGSTRYSTGPPQPSPATTDNYQEESDIHLNINSLSTQLVGPPSIRPSWDIPSRSAFLSGGGVNSGVGVGNISSCGGGGVGVGSGGGVSSSGSGVGGNSGSMRQHKKQRRKSRSGSSSPSGSSRSGSSSSSRSNSSAGSTSGDSSSPGSSPHRTGNAAVSEDRRPSAICVRNLPARSSDTSLKDGLFHEYKKHGKVTWVKVVGAAGDRYALVCFKKPEDVEKALEVSHDKLFFGCKIEVAPYQGYDVEDNEFRPYEAELDEYHPKATRTLFIGNLEKDVTASELKKHFEPFGEIIEIDIKKQGAVSSYAFCQYSDISSVVKAMRSMDGEHLGSNRIKLGFGKSMPTTCVWVDGIGECVSEKYLNMQFHQFGPINQVVVDRERGHALVFFEQINCAQTAVKEMRGASLRGRRLQVDFASRECQETFYEHLERQGVTGEKPWDSRPSPAATFDVARERSFEAAVTVPNAGSRFTRYETPPRARTASYSRTPGGGSTPGASPAHPTAMSRTSRRSYQADPYYEGDYTEPTSRRFRSYDEFSQGSGASHDDYDSSVLGDSKLNDDDLLPPPRRHAIQSVVTSVEPPAPSSLLLPPPDIRHLQKERVHLLEQLEECHSSGDEGFAPKKRPKLDSSSAILCDDDEPEIASLLVTSHSGRKGMDVRRVSDSKIIVHHNTRRGSCEGRGPGPCKRRRDTSSRHHEHHDSSRPGTPLVDERPENIIPSEPRRFRERSQEGPLSLPLPRFAAQMMNNNNTSNSNNNNNINNNNNSNNNNNNNVNVNTSNNSNNNNVNNNNINNNNNSNNNNNISSGSCVRTTSAPASKVTSPSCAVSLSSSVPSPNAAPQPPASPPPRHPSPSPTSSDSETAPQSPSLEERIRSLDEKYEKWSGSRALSAAGSDALAKFDATVSERFRFRPTFLDLELHEVQPSDIVKSVLAKRSVFDEDSKRLENFSEKYEPREFTGVTGIPSSIISTTSLSSSLASCSTSSSSTSNKPSVGTVTGTVTVAGAAGVGAAGVGIAAVGIGGTVAGTGTVQGSCSSGKVGLQYPFPSHPPVQQSSSTTSSSIGNMVMPPSSAVITTVATGTTPMTTLVSPSLKTDPRTAVHNCVHPTPATPITPGTSIKTASPELPPVSLPMGFGSGTAASINSSCFGTMTSASNISSNIPQPLGASTTRTSNIGSTSLSSGTTTSLSTSTSLSSSVSSVPAPVSSSNPVMSTIALVTTATTTITTSSSDTRHHHQTLISSSSTNHSTSVTNNNSISSASTTVITATATLTTPTTATTTITSTSTSTTDPSRVRQRKEGGSRDSRDSRHSRSKDGSRKNKKDDNDSEKNRNKERDDKDERSLLLSSTSIVTTATESSNETTTDTHNKDIKESKEARYERKEREERERRDKEERERQERRDKEDRDKQERKEREERERREKDEERREKERLDKERRDREEKERERKEREEVEAREKDKREKEKERLEKERKEREEKDKQERRDREERERKEREIRIEREKQEKERVRKEREELEKREKEERERVERERRREEKERIDRERKREREERERLERERRKEKEERERLEKEKREKEEKDKLEREKRERREREDLEKREKDKVDHAKRRDRDDKDKDTSSKRERDEREPRRQPIENHQHLANQNQNQASSPAPVTLKRRCSSQETPQEDDTNKRMKISEHRRDSKDRPRQNRRSEDRKHRNDSHRTSRESRENRDSKDSSTSTQSQDSRESRETPLQSHANSELTSKDIISSSRDIKECRENRENRDSRDSRESRESRDSRDNRENNRDVVTSSGGGGGSSSSKDKQRSKRNRLERMEKEQRDRSPRVSHELDKEFLTRIELAKRTDSSPPNNQTGSHHHHHHHHHHHRDSSQREHHHVSINLHSDNDDGHSSNHEMQTRHPSHTDTDSDEPKKHSIFDIVDDEPAYISMYDKVKARSTKNMQKLEEEKRQVRLKDKFSQLKQSRARREEKKQSTSWDGDSVSSKALTEDEGTSESDSTRAKSLSRKGSRSRIHSDTSEEDDSFNNKVHKIKTERFLESDVDLGFADTEEKHTPTETSSINNLRPVKQEPRSSDDDERMAVSFPSNHPVVNNHQRDSRKKSHKKKQKRQKLSISSEDGSINIKIESPDNNDHKNKNIITSSTDCRVNHVNDSPTVASVTSSTSVTTGSAAANEATEERIRAEKKQRNKKDKRRERTSEDKAKTRRKRLNRQEARDSQRMEDIFGPLSDDVDDAPSAPFFNRLGNLPSENNAYGSDSDGIRSPILDVDRVRRKAEKKRRHQIEDENSVDLAEAGREIEANLLGLPVSPKPAVVCMESNDHDVFRFTDDNDSIEPSTPTTAPEKVKEKKKKRKKSKEERSRKDYHHHHHHHHHHHDKAGALPYLGADPSPPRASSPISRKTISSPPPLPVSRDTILSPIPKNPTTISAITTTVTSPPTSTPSLTLVPTSTLTSTSTSTSTTSVVTSSTINVGSNKSDNKKKDKFIPGFGMDIDEKIHENAVKSISEPEERESGRLSGAGNHEPEVPAPVTPPPQVEDKPRVVISQEETEDAVAALLEETFGGSTEDFSYEGDEEEPEGDGASVPPSDAPPQEDVEEMQQAVESLNASTGAETDADLKPDTPQSEHDLQIDTDTEEDPNYESFDLTQPPKTPDIPSFYKSPVNKQQQQPIIATTTTTTIATTPSTTTTTTTTTTMTPTTEKSTANCTPATAPVSVRSPSPQPPVSSSVISHSWPEDHKPVINPSPQTETTDNNTEANKKDRSFVGHEVLAVKSPPSPSGQYKQPMPCSLPIISEAPRLSAASPRPPPVTSAQQQPLYQRLPVALQSQMVPPLRQTPPRMSVAVTTASSPSVTAPPTTVPSSLVAQSRSSSAIPSQQPSSRVSQTPLSPNGQWSRNIPMSSHLSHGIKTSSTTSSRIPVSVPLTTHRPSDIPSQHIYSTAATQQPVIQHAPGMRALAPSYPRGGLPPLTLNIPPRPYMPVPPLVSGIPRESGKPRDSMAFGGKSVIETLIPAHLNESPQRLDEPKLSPAIIPEPTNKASTSPKVPSPNQPPTFIPETAKIEISASTSTPAISKSSISTVESVVLSPRHQKQLPSNTNSVESDMLSPKQKQELTSVHLLTTHPPHTSAPSPVIVAHGQHLVHKSVVHSLVPTTVSQPNQPLIKTVVPIVSQQFSQPSHDKVLTTVAQQIHQPVGPSPAQQQQQRQPIPPISQGVLLVKPHIPLVSTVSQSLTTRVSTANVTSISTCVPVSSPQQLQQQQQQPQQQQHQHQPSKTPEHLPERQERFTDITKNKIEPIENLSTVQPTKFISSNLPSSQSHDVLKQEDKSSVIDLPKIKQEQDNKPVQVERLSDVIEVKTKPDKFDTEKTEAVTSVAPVNLSEPVVPKVEAQAVTETPKEIKRDEEDEAPKVEEDEEDIADEARESSNDPLAIDNAREDPADSKEDSDYWSAKEVNIESVIKTVDALCDGEGNDNETHDEEDSHHDQETNGEPQDTSKSEDWPDTESTEGDSKKDFSTNDDQDEGVETCEVESTRSRRVRSKTRRGGGRGGVSARRVNRTTTSGKRGGRTPRNSKQEKNKLPADVYEFHDDSEEDNAGRPRLILTIKSPGPTVAAGPNVPAPQPVAAVKEVAAEEFVSPATNTRKSKRLAEKDGSRSTVDDTIEDVVRGSAANKALLAAGVHATRRSTRHNNGSKPLQPQLTIMETRKSRGGRRTSRRTSENNEDSGEEKSKDLITSAVVTPAAPATSPPTLASAPAPTPVSAPVPTTTAATTRDTTNETTDAAKVAATIADNVIKQEPAKPLQPSLVQKSSTLEPMTLIDPVTGMLIPMRESEEGQYIPVSTASGQIQNIPRSMIETRTTTADIKSAADKYPPAPQVPSALHPRPVTEEAKAKAKPKPVPGPEVTAPSLEPADLSQPSKPQPSVITKSQAPAPAVQVTSSAVIQSTITPPAVSTPVLTTPPTNLVVTQPQITTTQCKPTSLKAHVLNPSKLASTPVAQQIVVSKPMMTPMPTQPVVQNIIKQPNQALQGLRLQIPPGRVASPSLSPRAKQQIQINSANGKPGQPMSPVLNSSNIPPNPKQHLLQAAKQQQHQQQQQQAPTIVNMQQKMGINVHPSNVATTPVQRIHNPVSQPTNLKGINGQSHLPNPKAHLLQAVVPTIMSGGVASPPTQPHIIGAQAVVSVASCSRPVSAKPQIAGMEPPKVEVSMSGCIMVPNASPGRVPVGVPYEPALHGPPGAPSPGGQYGLVPPHRTQSPPLPPPAHHHTNASQGDVVNHYGGLSRAGELPPPYMHPLQYQYLRAQQEAALTTPRIAYHVPDARSPHLPLDPKMEASGEESHSPPLELIRATRTPHDRTTDSPQVAQVYMMHGVQRLPAPPQYNTTSNPVFAGGPTGARGPYYEPPPAHIRSQYPMAASEAPDRALTPDRHRKHQVATPPHASQVPPQADSLLMLLRRYPVMWQGLLALKNDQAAVQMHFVFGNPKVAQDSLPCNSDRSTPPLRIAQRMRLEQTQVDGVARKMQTDNEHCMLLALPCGRDQMDVLQQSKNLQTGFITYLQQKQAAGIVNIAAPGSQQPAYVVHIFPSCDFANESLARIAPDLLHRVAEIAHLVIVIATV